MLTHNAIPLACAFLLSGTVAMAQTALTITTSDGVKTYDMAALAAFEQTSFTTENAFLDGKHVFSGPLLRDILADAEIASDDVTLSAINDYKIVFPVSDAESYDVIVSTSLDGEPMSVRDKGPLWLMYPIDNHPELADPVYKGRIIWQLVEISTP